MKVEIWSDVACPWCYIGKRRFAKALGQFEHRGDVEVTWRSFELDPSAASTYEESQPELLARKYGVPVEQAWTMNARMTEQARQEGLEFRLDIAKPGNTFDAHRLIHYAGTVGKQEALVERLFRGYLCEGAAIGNADALVQLGADAGLDAEGVRRVLGTDAYSLEVRGDEARARQFGISGVPFFALDERLGVSGAQTPDVLLAALRQAYEEKTSLVVVAGGDADKCDEDGCSI